MPKIIGVKYLCNCGNVYEVNPVGDIKVLRSNAYICIACDRKEMMNAEFIYEKEKEGLKEEIKRFMLVDKSLKCLHDSIPESIADGIVRMVKKKVLDAFDMNKDVSCPLPNSHLRIALEKVFEP